jgi:anion-transporting  ArsA/GET3 family ATPase
MFDSRLILVSGKGGTGKSAVAAGIALVAQRRGQRVLAMDAGPDGGLSGHLTTPELEFDPREVRPGLHAMKVERPRALLEYLSLQLKLPGVGRFGNRVARAFDALATAAPAVREIITIGKVYWEVQSGRWDTVVVDGPPTGQIGSYLRAPTSIMDLVPSGRIRGQAEAMAAMFADPDITRPVIVTIPEELPATETRETLDWLEAHELVPTPTVVANRLLPDLEVAKTPAGVAGEMVELHRSLVAEQKHWLSQLPADITLPYLFGLYTPGEVAANLSDHLEGLT